MVVGLVHAGNLRWGKGRSNRQKIKWPALKSRRLTVQNHPKPSKTHHPLKYYEILKPRIAQNIWDCIWHHWFYFPSIYKVFPIHRFVLCFVMLSYCPIACYVTCRTERGDPQRTRQRMTFLKACANSVGRKTWTTHLLLGHPRTLNDFCRSDQLKGGLKQHEVTIQNPLLSVQLEVYSGRHVHTHIYIYTYTYIHIYIYTHNVIIHIIYILLYCLPISEICNCTQAGWHQNTSADRCWSSTRTLKTCVVFNPVLSSDLWFGPSSITSLGAILTKVDLLDLLCFDMFCSFRKYYIYIYAYIYIIIWIIPSSRIHICIPGISLVFFSRVM